MKKNIIKFFNIASALVVGSIVLMNCESDADILGSQFFTGAVAVDSAYAIVAYNYNNGDTIRTDASKLDSIVLGAFAEPKFGMQKASYVTQVRLSTYDPDFGDNPVLDSAVLVLKPAFDSDSITTTTTEDYTYSDEDNDSVAAKKVVNTYPIKKYGRTKINNKTIFNIKVHQVDDFLGAASDEVRSNKSVALGAELGTKTFNGDVTSIKITKDSDNSDLYVREAGIRIPLDATFFQNNIILKEDTSVLSDAASFIRYFKGLRISVAETDGYLFKMLASTMELNLYYKNDKVVDNVTTRQSLVYQMNLSTANARFSQIEYNRADTAFETAMATNDTINGDSRLFIQGMGGPGAGFKVQASTMDYLKQKYEDDKIGIISAKIRIYTDPIDWNNSYAKPQSFVVRAKSFDNTTNQPTDLYSFLTDMSTLAYSGFYSLVKANNLTSNPAYYDIGITQSLKNIIEKTDETKKDFIINVGDYTRDVNGNLVGSYYEDTSQNYNTRSYTPNRALFLGTITNTADPLYDKGAKLLITYGTK